jgi:Na+/serine symporter
MKRKDILTLVVTGIFSATIAFLITSVIFSTPLKRSSKVPAVNPVPTSMPDVKNDSSYNTIFNSNALDIAQPVQVGNSQNNTPFNGTQ